MQHLLFISLLLSLFPISLVSASPVLNNTLALRGTLIVMIPNRDGITICADKRATDDARGAADVSTKIVQLDKATAFATSGSTLFLNRRNFAPLFDVKEIVKQYFFEKTFKPSEELWTDFKKTVLGKFKNSLLENPDTYPQPENPPHYVLFKVSFLHLNETQKMSAFFVYFKYRDAKTPLGMDISQAVDNTFDVATPIIQGEQELFQEIVKGKDARFDDLRSDKQFRRFLFDKVPAKVVGLEETIDFSKRFIKTSSERSSWLKMAATSVSSVSDCAIITYKDGFKWVSKSGKT